jgi:hypothetical protein
MLKAAEEVEALRKYLTDSIASEWMTQDVKDQQAIKLASLDEPDGEYRLYFGTLDYGATGEGNTMKFLALGARSRGDFLKRCAGEISGYYALGLDIYDRLPERDSVCDFLVSAAIKEWIIKEADRGGNVRIHLSHHVNYS